MNNPVTLHDNLLNKIQGDLLRVLNSKEKAVKNYTNDELLRTIFVNYRLEHGKKQGLRLTNFGNKILSKYYQFYKYSIEDELNHFVFITLDKSMKWPYYLGTRSNHIIFYSEEDAAWFRLNGNKIRNYVESI